MTRTFLGPTIPVAGQPAPRHEGTRLTPAPPPGRLIDSPAFPTGAARELANPVQRGNLKHAMTAIRTKRQRCVAELEHWEQMRQAGEAIKNRTLRHLDQYLLQLEESLTATGPVVHWARDVEEANQIATRLVKEALADEEVTYDGTGLVMDEVVKVKSMVTQEIGLNEALEAERIASWETDLAEIIVQLGHDHPSHFLVPAIHRNRAEVREIFLDEMGNYGRPAPEDLDSEPRNLAGAARLHLREKFLRAKVGISGANFMVAETGTLVVVESEGNGRMCLTLPQTLISIVGIEKVVLTFDDLEVFLQLLPRSSTAERMNPYTSLWTGPDPEGKDGPEKMKNRKGLPFVAHGEPAAMTAAAKVMGNPRLWRAAVRSAGAGGTAFGVIRKDTIGPIPGTLSGWTNARDVPAPPAQSFRAWWKKEDGGDAKPSKGAKK